MTYVSVEPSRCSTTSTTSCPCRPGPPRRFPAGAHVATAANVVALAADVEAVPDSVVAELVSRRREANSDTYTARRKQCFSSLLARQTMNGFIGGKPRSGLTSHSESNTRLS